MNIYDEVVDSEMSYVENVKIGKLTTKKIMKIKGKNQKIRISK